jgi:hypothetical protein
LDVSARHAFRGDAKPVSCTAIFYGYLLGAALMLIPAGMELKLG